MTSSNPVSVGISNAYRPSTVDEGGAPGRSRSTPGTTLPSGSSATSLEVVVTKWRCGSSFRISKSTISDVLSVGSPSVPATNVFGFWFVMAASVTVQSSVP